MSKKAVSAGKFRRLAGIFTALLLVVGGGYYLKSSYSMRPPSLDLGGSQFQGLIQIGDGTRQFLGFDEEDKTKFDIQRETFSRNYRQDDRFEATKMTFNSGNSGLYYMYPEKDMSLAELISTIDPAATALLVAHWNPELNRWAITPNTAFVKENEVHQLKMDEFNDYEIQAGNAVVVMAQKSTTAYGLFNGDRSPVNSFDVCAQEHTGWYNFAVNDFEDITRCKDRVDSVWVETSIEPVKYEEVDIEKLADLDPADLDYSLVWAHLDRVDSTYTPPVKDPDTTTPDEKDVVDELTGEYLHGALVVKFPAAEIEGVEGADADYELTFQCTQPSSISRLKMKLVNIVGEAATMIVGDNEIDIGTVSTNDAGTVTYQVSPSSLDVDENCEVVTVMAEAKYTDEEKNEYSASYGSVEIRLNSTDDNGAQDDDDDQVQSNKVENFVAKYSSATGLTLSWDGSNKAESYKIEYSEAGNVSGKGIVTWTTLKNIALNGPAIKIGVDNDSAKVTNLPAGTYKFRITALYSDGTVSEPATSSEVVVPEETTPDTGDDDTTTSRLSKVVFGGFGEYDSHRNALDLEWKSIAGAMKYEVSYQEVSKFTLKIPGQMTKGSEWTKLGAKEVINTIKPYVEFSKDGRKEIATVRDLTADTAYKFKIVAIDADGVAGEAYYTEEVSTSETVLDFATTIEATQFIPQEYSLTATYDLENDVIKLRWQGAINGADPSTVKPVAIEVKEASDESVSWKKYAMWTVGIVNHSVSEHTVEIYNDEATKLQPGNYIFRLYYNDSELFMESKNLEIPQAFDNGAVIISVPEARVDKDGNEINFGDSSDPDDCRGQYCGDVNNF